MPTPFTEFIRQSHANEWQYGKSSTKSKNNAYYSAWEQWNKSKKTPDDNAALLKAIDPEIRSAAYIHTGKDDPLTLSKAQIMALSSLNSYDPEKAELSTYIHSQLQPLKREVRNQAKPIKIPEGAFYEKQKIEQATLELEHELGRPPTDEEISLKTGIPIKRIGNIRKYNTGVSISQFDEQGATPAFSLGDKYNEAWVQLVYDDLNPRDKIIMEHTLGLNGKKVLSNQDLAKKLKITPGAVSQAKARIQKALDEEEKYSPFQ